MTLWTCLWRIKRGGSEFGRRSGPIYDEWYNQRVKGLISGVVSSIVMLLLGIGLHPLMLVGIIIFSILFTLNKRFSWLSSAYTYGFTAIELLFYSYYKDYLYLFLDLELFQLDLIFYNYFIGVFLVI